MGAFYLSQLTFLAKLTGQIPAPQKLILFNPVVTPIQQFKKYVGQVQINTTTSEHFMFSQEVWDSYQYAQLPDKNLTQGVECVLCVAKNDELIDSQRTQAYWQDCARIIEFEGGHKIQDFSMFKHFV